MAKNIILCIIMMLILTSCLQRPHFPCIIYSTSISRFTTKCVYYTKEVKDKNLGSFIDSCGKYRVGDTIYTSK